ncbi:sulfur carrier protein ThiS [Fusibacter ferrireducens]|uniref:Sulfur carrier protein ThiS n=1 Tax=Fusibacter ferrireducens TaxID=2785058 RepID=A0ABR9ZPU1_9FIRM|nr:sulfur carrier protein ThiS [Fusibacter ferrireducens]MBF4692459.1 sulfur carrier protein ThiS [Fusibacter ferrireducens]
MFINGTLHPLRASMTLKAFLESEGYDLNRIATEMNGQIVPKSAYENTLIEDSTRLEVVSFVGGG